MKKYFYVTNKSTKIIDCQKNSESKTGVSNISNESNKNRVNSNKIFFPKNLNSPASFDFGPFYGQGHDDITKCFDLTIRKLTKESENTMQASVAICTVASYCCNGLTHFFKFLSFYCINLRRKLTLNDICFDLIEHYILHLKSLEISVVTQKTAYSCTKSVLMASYKQGRFSCADIKRLFPENPFPYSNRRKKGQRALTEHEKKELVSALKIELSRIYGEKKQLDFYDLSMCVINIALFTGMNRTPILELTTDCIKPHPLKANLSLLVSQKRRNHSIQFNLLLDQKSIDDCLSVDLKISSIIKMIVQRNKRIRDKFEDPMHLLVASTGSIEDNQTKWLTVSNLNQSIKLLVKKHELIDDDGNPLVFNMKRLRQTFVNRVWELSGQNSVLAARAGKHKPSTADAHYWEAPVEAESNMRFLGEARVQEMRNGKSSSQKTPVASCNNNVSGHRAPRNGSICTELLGCFRCKDFVVTEDDLYRLFSFYWAVLRARNDFGIKRWNKYLKNILRIIDNDISPQFDVVYVKLIKDKAKKSPHPFWKDLDIVRLAT